MFGLDDMAAATLIGSGVNFLGGLFSNSSNADTNKENREWQSHENELSRKFQQGENSLDRGMQNYWNQRSLDWQEKMWNLQNQYNTPSAMMARYKEAGLNPYLNGLSQMGSGAGAAGSPGSPSIGTSPAGSSAPLSGSPSSIPMVAPHLDLAGALGVSANIKNQQADALHKISMSLPELGRTLGWDNARKVASKLLDLNGVTGSQYESLLDEQISSYRLQNQMQQIQNGIASKYGDRKAGLECSNLEQTFSKISAEIGKMASDTKVNESVISKNKAEIRKMASEFVRNHAEALKMAAETNTINQIRQYVVSSAKHQASIIGMEDTSKRAVFNGSVGIREYLNSGEGIGSLRDAFILKAERDADEFWSLVLQLGNVNVGASVHN